MVRAESYSIELAMDHPVTTPLQFSSQTTEEFKLESLAWRWARANSMNTDIEMDRVNIGAERAAAIVPVFALALFTSAALLFWVQPLRSEERRVGKECRC